MIDNKDKLKFQVQKRHAKERGILFEMSFGEWIKWWENNLGHNWRNLRGRKRGQYCMSRIEDKGSYRIDNIECKLTSENCIERKENGTAARGETFKRSKLNINDVLAIFHSKKDQYTLCNEYKIKLSQVIDIRCKRTWKWLLEDEIYNGKRNRWMKRNEQ